MLNVEKIGNSLKMISTLLCVITVIIGYGFQKLSHDIMEIMIQYLVSDDECTEFRMLLLGNTDVCFGCIESVSKKVNEIMKEHVSDTIEMVRQMKLNRIVQDMLRWSEQEFDVPILNEDDITLEFMNAGDMLVDDVGKLVDMFWSYFAIFEVYTSEYINTVTDTLVYDDTRHVIFVSLCDFEKIVCNYMHYNDSSASILYELRLYNIPQTKVINYALTNDPWDSISFNFWNSPQHRSNQYNFDLFKLSPKYGISIIGLNIDTCNNYGFPEIRIYNELSIDFSGYEYLNKSRQYSCNLNQITYGYDNNFPRIIEFAFIGHKHFDIQITINLPKPYLGTTLHSIDMISNRLYASSGKIIINEDDLYSLTEMIKQPRNLILN